MDVASSRFLSGGSGSLVPAGLVLLGSAVISHLSSRAVRDCPSHFGPKASRFYHPRPGAGRSRDGFYLGPASRNRSCLIGPPEQLAVAAGRRPGFGTAQD